MQNLHNIFRLYLLYVVYICCNTHNVKKGHICITQTNEYVFSYIPINTNNNNKTLEHHAIYKYNVIYLFIYNLCGICANIILYIVYGWLACTNKYD